MIHKNLVRLIMGELPAGSHFEFPSLTFGPILPAVAAALFALAPTCRAQVQIQIGKNFTGATLGVDSELIPPDGDGAIGPAHFVELVNGRFSVYDKSTGQQVQTKTDLSFWAAAGVTVPAGWLTTDPRVVYDPSVQRWFASQVDEDPTLAINTDNFLLAVSVTADPTGAWKGVAIPTDPGGNNFGDFPTLGLDGQGVYLSADLFDVNGSPLDSTTLVSIPKAGLLASAPTTNGYTGFGVLTYSTRGAILQPVNCVDGSGNGTILAPGGLGLDDAGNFITNDTLIAFNVQNAAGPGKATLNNSTIISVADYTAPFNPSQPLPNPGLDDGDSRFSARIVQVQGVCYAIHSTDVDNRAALRWYRIDATNHTLLEVGIISDPQLDLYYGSIAANANGTVVIACNGSSANTFISSYATAGLTVNGVTTFGDLVLLKSGLAVYSDGNTSGASAWGDYSTTSVDPSDPTRFWTIQLYPSSSSAWSTQITELVTSIPAPSLSITQSNNQVVLTWSASAVGFNLENTASLSVPSWAPVSPPPTIVGGQAVVQVPATTDATFFRLHLATGQR
jgi:hypothetical protein